MQKKALKDCKLIDLDQPSLATLGSGRWAAIADGRKSVMNNPGEQ